MIFDLDDTLIETSRCLTPHALKNAHQAMEIAAPIEQLIAINDQSLTSKEAVRTFWSRYSRAEEVLEKGLEGLKKRLPHDLPLYRVDGALDLLKELSKDHLLALVTRGEEKWQREKMKKAGIQPELFSKLIVSNGLSKKNDYLEVLGQLQVEARHAVVCGDRIVLDLLPAKELGMTTVHFRNGRGKKPTGPIDCVDLTIDALCELTKVLPV